MVDQLVQWRFEG